MAGSWFRLLFASACLVAALPNLIAFQSLLLWKANLVVGEYGHRLAVLPGLLLIVCLLQPGPLARISALLSFAATGLFLLPLALMLIQARSLDGDFKFAFSPQSAHPAPDFSQLFWGRSPAVVKAEEILIEQPSHSLRLLFYRSQTNAAAPCIITLHSGSWERGDPAEFPSWSHYWAHRGFAVCSIDYRLAPNHPWPAQRDDVVITLNHLKHHAAALGIAKDQFVLLGRSAGGQIASACAHGLHDPAIRGCVSLYAPADLFFAWQYADPNDVLDSPRLLRQYLSGSPEQNAETYRTASAIKLTHPASPPTLLIHGQRDILVWELQSRRFAAQLKKAQVPHYFLQLPWATHAMDYPFHGPSSHLIRPAIDAFLDHVTSAPPTS